MSNPMHSISGIIDMDEVSDQMTTPVSRALVNVNEFLWNLKRIQKSLNVLLDFLPVFIF